MSKTIYPNDACPCGSGKKYKKCCQHKLNIPEEKMSIAYWVDYIKDNNLSHEQSAFFEREKAVSDNQLVHIVGNIKQCFARGVIDYENIFKSVNTPRVEYSAVPEEHFKILFVEAGSQFIAQMNDLREEEFLMIRAVLDNAVKKKYGF